MVWRQVSDTQWERPLDGLEAFFVVTANMSASLCDGREHYTLFASLNLQINSHDVESDLRHAWKQLRHEQPQIATTIQDMKRVYAITDEHGLNRWLTETFIVSDALNAEEMQKVTQPIKQTTLCYVPKSSEHVIRGRHYTIGCTGMGLLCHSFLNALAHPDEDITFGDEPVVSSLEFLKAPAPKDALVSSLGIVENFINREYAYNIKVKGFKFGADIVLGMSILFFYTFQGRLRLVYSFNDGFEKAEDIKIYSERMERRLIEEFRL
ncbi:hypothetical protein ACHAPD_008419 [Fusarium lateritium]